MDTPSYTPHIKAVAVLLICWYILAHSIPFAQNWSWLDGVDLIIHEAGHTIFIFLGGFMNILGGSLLQVLVPAILAGYFLLQRQYASGTFLLMWVGQSIVNVSIYMADAVVMQLPLLGGDGVGHDWNNLFSMTGLLSYTNTISWSIYVIGILTIISGAAFCIWHIYRGRLEV